MTCSSHFPLDEFSCKREALYLEKQQQRCHSNVPRHCSFMGGFYTTTVEYRILQISPWDILNRKCVSKLAALYYLLRISMALLLYLSYASILFPFQEQHLKMGIFLSLWINKAYCGLSYFFPQEYKKETVYFTLSALAASLLVSLKKVLMKLNRWKKISWSVQMKQPGMNPFMQDSRWESDELWQME